MTAEKHLHRQRDSALQRRRILYFHGGESRYDEFFVNELRNHFKVDYVTLNPHPSVRFQTEAPIVLHHPLAFFHALKLTRPIVQLSSVQTIRSLIRNVKPDAVVGCYATTYGYLCAKSGFKPNILFVWGSDVVIDPRNPILSSLVKTALSHADLILLDSMVQEKAALGLGAEKEKIVRLPCVDAESIADFRTDAKSFRKLLNWQDKLIILCTRKHEKVYQVDNVVRAFVEVRKSYPQSRLILAGSGSESGHLKRLVSSLGVESEVLFTGWVSKEEVISLCDEADLYVSASLSDGTSASLIEAMARRVLVVASNIEGNREWIDNGKNGFLFDSHSVNELADKIVEGLSLRPELREEMVDSAQLAVLGRANWGRNKIQLIRAIEELIKTK